MSKIWQTHYQKLNFNNINDFSTQKRTNFSSQQKKSPKKQNKPNKKMFPIKLESVFLNMKNEVYCRY